MEEAVGGIFGLVFAIVILALVIIPFWQIWKRTGHSGWLSLLMIIPLANIISLYVLAFKRWPARDSVGPVSDRFE